MRAWINLILNHSHLQIPSIRVLYVLDTSTLLAIGITQLDDEIGCFFSIVLVISSRLSCSTVTEGVVWSEINKYGFINQLLNATKGSLRTLHLHSDCGASCPPELSALTRLNTLSLHTTSASSNSFDFEPLFRLLNVNLTLLNGATPLTISPVEIQWFFTARAALKSLILHKTAMDDLRDLVSFPLLETFESWGPSGASSNWPIFTFPSNIISITLCNLPLTSIIEIQPQYSANYLETLHLVYAKNAGEKAMKINVLPPTLKILSIEGYSQSTLDWTDTASAVPRDLAALSIRNVSIPNPGLPNRLQATSLSYLELQLSHTSASPLSGFPDMRYCYISTVILNGFGWTPEDLGTLLCERLETSYIYKLHIYEPSMLTAVPRCMNSSRYLYEVSLVGAPIDIIQGLPLTITTLSIDQPALPINHITPTTHAQYARMASTYLTQFRSIPSLFPSLVYLGLTNGNNKVSFAFPSYELQNIGTTLRFLDLSGNNITGTIAPYWLSHMTALRSLNLNDNFMRGEFPWIGYQLLQKISARNNNFTSWPTVENPQNLQSVDFSGNRYLSRIPNLQNWRDMVNLVSVDLSHTDLSRGPIPDIAFKYGSPVTHFIADDSGLSGPLPSPMENWNLEVLSLQNTKACGAIPPISVFEDIAYLYHLDLSGTEVSGTLPASLGARFWDFLDISSTSVSGSVISPQFHPTHPSYINFSRNSLNGNMFPVDDAGESWIAGRKTQIDLERTAIDFCSSEVPVNITSPFVCQVTLDTNACTCSERWAPCAATPCTKKRDQITRLFSFESTFAGSYEAFTHMQSSSKDLFTSRSRDELHIKRQPQCFELDDWPALMDRPPELTPPSTDGSTPDILCLGPPPALNAICIRRNVWRVPGSLNTTKLVVPKNTRIEIAGDLVLLGKSSSFVYNDWRGFVSVAGCLSFDGARLDPADWRISINVEKGGYSAITTAGTYFQMGEQNTSLISCGRINQSNLTDPTIITVPAGLRFKMTGKYKSGCGKLEAANMLQPASYSQTSKWQVRIRRNTNTCKVIAGVLTPILILIVVGIIVFCCIWSAR